jgi:hypothetical protein
VPDKEKLKDKLKKESDDSKTKKEKEYNLDDRFITNTKKDSDANKEG